ncbi:PDZ and LIM domain protein 2 [Polypterus senegalus]|uniref:PDZ and LIM domain protein 2 n=1 Tax=Polypterus senegalus TaxID=55291 RepID=UPI0019637F3B|nr:PDZ and LIM domain protein 2 [Polypterus senegalus]XP_039625553.1 PDZ and LIM domain protein 2 [Polypterus senegalus]
MALQVNLKGPSPWGFRISGGRDFKKPISVSKVNGGSKADLADLRTGDVILEINGQSTTDMLNVEAQNKIKSSNATLLLLVERPEPAPASQSNGVSTPDHLGYKFQEALQCSRDENYNNYTFPSPTSPLASPFSPEPLNSRYSMGNGKWDNTYSSKSAHTDSWSPVEKTISPRVSQFSPAQNCAADVRSNSLPRTPTPPGRYSPRSPGDKTPDSWVSSNSPRRSSDTMQKFDRDSEVYKMIQENKESRAAPRQSNTFRMLQEVLEADEKEAAARFPGKFSPTPPKTTQSVAGVQKFHICEKCHANIVTQAVRITEDCYRHPECYTCTQCGLNLKMRGHFWVDEEMYCEKHARERYQGPQGATVTLISHKS